MQGNGSSFINKSLAGNLQRLAAVDQPMDSTMNRSLKRRMKLLNSIEEKRNLNDGRNESTKFNLQSFQSQIAQSSLD